MKKLLLLLLLLPVFTLAQKTVTTLTITTVKDKTGAVLKSDSSYVTSTILPDTIQIGSNDTVIVTLPPVIIHDTTVINNTVIVHDTVTVTNTVVIRDTITVTNTVVIHDTVYVSNPPPINHAPTANAGADKTLQLPGSITITGTGSDPDGDAITGTWSRIEGNNQTFVGNGFSFTLNNPAAGSYTYNLRVLDSKGLDATDQMFLTVKAAQPPPSGGGTYQISFPQLTSDYTRPGSGAEYWYGGLAVAIPGVQPQDMYHRFNWAGLNPGDGQYNWAEFDKQINIAIDNNRKFSFGIMTQYLGGKGSVGNVTIDGKGSAYPLWLHNKMMAESVKPFLDKGPDGGGNDWVPVWNSESYLSALEKFNIALNAHLQNTTYKGVKYKDAILFIDIRGYGNFGEWHTWPYGDGPVSGNKATAATLSRIIDSHKNAFSGFRLVSMVDGMDGGGWSSIPLSVSYKLLTDRNDVGDFGIRRDSWGAIEAWYNSNLWEKNPNSYSGQKFSTMMMDKWKTAPITGEPCCASSYSDLPNQVVKYHINSFGNGNGLNGSSYVAAANKASGNKVSITSATLVVNPGAIAVTMNWTNSFIPMYEDVKVIYELRQGSTVKFSMQSSFTPTLFQPGTKTVTDNFNNIPSGTYDLYIVVKDVSGYRNVALGIQGNRSGYLIKSGISL